MFKSIDVTSLCVRIRLLAWVCCSHGPTGIPGIVWELLFSVSQCANTVQGFGVFSGLLKHRAAADPLTHAALWQYCLQHWCKLLWTATEQFSLTGFPLFLCFLEKERKHTFLVLLGTYYSTVSWVSCLEPCPNSLHTASAFAQLLIIACVELKARSNCWPSHYMADLVHASVTVYQTFWTERLYTFFECLFPLLILLRDSSNSSHLSMGTLD